MEDLNIQVLQGFGVRAKRIVKEKSYYICNTDKGVKLIRKSFDTGDHILFQHDIKEHLHAQGFCCTDKFDLSTANKPFVEYDNNIFTMNSLLGGRETNFTDNRAFEKAIRQVALFHKTAQNIKFSGKVYYGEGELVLAFIKNMTELKSIKKRVSNQKRLSDFDVLFLKNYNFYICQMETAIDLLEKTNLKQYMGKARENSAICHGLLKEENILMDNGQIYIVNFSHAVVGYTLFDLCNLIQRYSKFLPSQYLPIRNIIDLYGAVYGLEKEELLILYPLLIFPYKFVRICNQYYSKKRTWTPSAITNRMEMVVNGKDAYHAYVEELKKP